MAHPRWRGPISGDPRDVLRRDHTALTAKEPGWRSSGRCGIAGSRGTLNATCAAWSTRPAGTRWSASPDAAAPNRHSLNRKLKRRASAHGFNLIRAFFEVVARDGPTISPEQRANIQHAGTAPVEVRFIVAGELLHAAAQVDQAKMTGPNDATAGSHEELAATEQHRHARMVQVRAGNLGGPADANVVAGIRAATATAMGG